MNYPLERTCALLLHGDEGGVFEEVAAAVCVSTHSILGFGISTSHRARKKEQLKLNYEEPTWTTRFLLSVCPSRIYKNDDGEDADAFQDLMRGLAQDLRTLSNDGVRGLDGQLYYFVVVNGFWQ